MLLVMFIPMLVSAVVCLGLYAICWFDEQRKQ